MIHFDSIQVGQLYDRPALARLWGYQTHHAISRGVVTPAGQSLLVFFVTRHKQDALTQYEDHIDSDTLFWEGEVGHGNDARIVSRRDDIHVFYRDRHHTPFVYEGLAVLMHYRLYQDRPSKFEFQLISRKVTYGQLVAEIKHSYGISNTEKEAIIKSRVGQGIYREESIKLWGSCCVTGFTKHNVLVASHIRPWKLSSNEERLNPYNSLLLVPTLDKLFDRGYLTFDTRGKVLLSDKVSRNDWLRVHVDKDVSLRKLPAETNKFLIP